MLNANFDFATEEWKPVCGFEEAFEISNFGRVRNCNTGHLRVTCFDRTGRAAIRLSVGRKKRTSRVQDLVAAAFIGPKAKGSEVNHKDGDKKNNRSANLEYVTKRQNFEHGLTLGIIKLVNTPKLSEEAVKIIRLQSAHYSQKQLSIQYGVSKRTINDILNRKTWKNTA